jgi:hypothetical protein
MNGQLRRWIVRDGWVGQRQGVPETVSIELERQGLSSSRVRPAVPRTEVTRSCFAEQSPHLERFAYVLQNYDLSGLHYGLRILGG